MKAGHKAREMMTMSQVMLCAHGDDERDTEKEEQKDNVILRIDAVPATEANPDEDIL